MARSENLDQQEKIEESEVTCVNKPDRFSSHEDITHIGNVTKSVAYHWESAIQRIDAQEERFYTLHRSTGEKVSVGVVRNDGSKAPYLGTYADGNGRTICWLWPNATELARPSAKSCRS
jgi:hypothetical protein